VSVGPDTPGGDPRMRALARFGLVMVVVVVGVFALPAVAA
jgi:hypothetical protein